jgi:hypothetical protein
MSSIIDRSLSPPIIVNFSSKNRIAGTNSNFTSTPYELGINTFDSVCLVQASIPRSFYNVPSAYNTFTLSENGVLKTITMPAGTYNRINFQTVLQTSINAISTYTYTVSYPNTVSSADTYKFTFTVNNSNPVRFIFTDSLFRQMGFNQSSNNLFVAQSLTSVNCINLAYITDVYIKSDVCVTDDSVLSEILNYGTFPMLSLAYYQQVAFDTNTRTFNSVSSASWNFVLVDSFGQEVDLNGIPWYFSLIFFQRNNLNEIQKKELQVQNEEKILEIEREREVILSKINNTNEPNLLSDMFTPIGSSVVPEFLPVVAKDEKPSKK